MPSYSLTINGTSQRVTADADTPLLWVLRDHLGLTGTKYGCGAGQCGACTVHANGTAARSCQLPVSSATALRISTIDGEGDRILETCRASWLEEDVAQCGYCQAGVIMASAALLRTTPSPTSAQIDAAITNICRCGTYPRIKRAILRAASTLKAGPGTPTGSAPNREETGA